MKLKILTFLILNFCLVHLYSQGHWSISIAYAPRIEHRGSYIKNLFYYPLSPGIITDYQISKKLSFSGGVLFHYETDKYQSYGTPPIISEYKSYIFEIPFQSDFHFYKEPNKLDPFIKTAIRYTRNDNSVTRQILADFSRTYNNDSYFLWDFGAGLNIKIHESYFFRCQISYGLGIKHEYKNFRYFEPLISFGYNFKKQ